MATTKFNLIITDMARILKASRALATDDAGSYTSALLTRYANRAIREFLIERIQQISPFQFAEAFPEYVKESGALMLSTGFVAKPFDSIYIIEVRQGNVRFSRVQQKDVEGMITGMNRTMVPSATKPFFWEENGSIHTLGITTGNITVRYIVVHQDIAPVTAALDAGNFSAGVSTYTAATREIDTTANGMNVSFAAADINRPIAFRTATNCYFGFIDTYTSAKKVTVRSNEALPGNSTLTQIIVGSVGSGTDLILNEYWHPEIVQRCVQMALADAKNTQLS